MVSCFAIHQNRTIYSMKYNYVFINMKDLAGFWGFGVLGFWIFPWVKEFWRWVHFGSNFFLKSYIFELNKRFSTSKSSGQAKIAIEAGHLL